MRSPINLQWVHGGFRLPFGCVELCVVPTMGEIIGESGRPRSKQNALASWWRDCRCQKWGESDVFVLQEILGQMRLIEYIYIYWYEIHIWWGYTPWDPRGGCFCVFNLSSTFQRLEPFPSCASALRWKFTGNGCDASRGSIEASFESSWANWCPQSFIIIPNWQVFMEFLTKKILADFFLGFRDSFC